MKDISNGINHSKNDNFMINCNFNGNDDTFNTYKLILISYNTVDIYVFIRNEGSRNKCRPSGAITVVS